MASVSGCSQGSGTQDAAVTFFDALHKTMSAQSMVLEGEGEAQAGLSGKLKVHAVLDQRSDLQAAVTTTLTAYGLTLDPFLDFYIRDGHTYLNSQGTKSSSTLKALGLDENTKLSAWDPFLSLTDKEKAALFKSARVDGDTYSFEIDPTKVSTLLDSMGGADISTASVEAVIKDGYVTKLVLDIAGTQTMDDRSQDFKFKIDLKVKGLDQDVQMNWPDDLADWPVQ